MKSFLKSLVVLLSFAQPLAADKDGVLAGNRFAALADAPGSASSKTLKKRRAQQRKKDAAHATSSECASDQDDGYVSADDEPADWEYQDCDEIEGEIETVRPQASQGICCCMCKALAFTTISLIGACLLYLAYDKFFMPDPCKIDIELIEKAHGNLSTFPTTVYKSVSTISPDSMLSYMSHILTQYSTTAPRFLQAHSQAIINKMPLQPLFDTNNYHTCTNQNGHNLCCLTADGFNIKCCLIDKTGTELACGEATIKITNEPSPKNASSLCGFKFKPQSDEFEGKHAMFQYLCDKKHGSHTGKIDVDFTLKNEAKETYHQELLNLRRSSSMLPKDLDSATTTTRLPHIESLFKQLLPKDLRPKASVVVYSDRSDGFFVGIAPSKIKLALNIGNNDLFDIKSDAQWQGIIAHEIGHAIQSHHKLQFAPAYGTQESSLTSTVRMIGEAISPTFNKEVHADLISLLSLDSEKPNQRALITYSTGISSDIALQCRDGEHNIPAPNEPFRYIETLKEVRKKETFYPAINIRIAYLEEMGKIYNQLKALLTETYQKTYGEIA